MRITRVCHGLLAALATLCAGAAHTQPVQAPIPVESFYRLPSIVSATLSPSGRWLGMTMGIGARIELVTLDLEHPADAVRVASFSDADVRTFQWVNDDRLVLDVIDFSSGGGDQRFAQSLFSAKRDGTEVRQLVKAQREFLTERRIGPERLAWNHFLIGVPSGGGNEVVVGAMRFDTARELIQVTPLMLDVSTQRTRSLALGAPDLVREWLFDTKGEARVAVAESEGQARISWRAPGKTSWQEIGRFDALRPDFSPVFVNAAGQLFVTTEGPGGASVLKRFDFDAGKPAAEAIISAKGFDFRGSFVEDYESGKALGVRVTTDGETTVWFDARMKKLQQAVDAHFPGRSNRVSCRKCGADDMVVLVRSWSDQEPGQIWLYRPAADAWQSVGRVRPDIDPARMATLDLYRFRARDGLEIPAWVTLPQGAPKGKPLPTVVLVHGGPFTDGQSWGWHADAQFLASRGYAVIEPEFRGTTGYGYAHFRAGWKQWGLAMQDDVADAARWAASQGWTDPKRVCIAGASYGGYATLMGLIKDPDLYRCGVAWVAVSDPRLLYGLPWINDISDEAQKYGLPVLLGDPKTDAAALAAVAPVELAARIKVPLLLAYGGEDSRVPLEHGLRMRAALRAAGQEPEWVVYEDEGHGWLKPANRYDFARRVERFLAKNLQVTP